MQRSRRFQTMPRQSASDAKFVTFMLHGLGMLVLFVGVFFVCVSTRQKMGGV